VFDKPSAISAAIVLGFAGTGVAMGMPLLVGSMAKSLGFSEQQLGWLASSDMGGLCAGSILAALMVTKINRRVLAATGLLLVILANYLSTQSPDLLPLMLSRLFAGIGAGICYSTCTASLAGSHNAARTFSILLFVLVVMNAFIFYIFPIIEGRWGVNGLFLFYLLEAVPIFFDTALASSLLQRAN
jgi:predicted MFS family arabinose efflux permease